MKHNNIVIWLSVSAVIHVFLLLWMHFTPLAVPHIATANDSFTVSFISPAEAAALPRLPIPPPDPIKIINKPGVPQPLGNSKRNVPGPNGKVPSKGPGEGSTAPPKVLTVENSTFKVGGGIPDGKGTDSNSTNTRQSGPIGETHGAAIESIGIPIYPKGNTDGDETTVTLNISVGANGKYLSSSAVSGASWAISSAVAKAKKGSYKYALTEGVAVTGTVTKSWRYNSDGTVTAL